jgi:hypothetical protein
MQKSFLHFSFSSLLFSLVLLGSCSKSSGPSGPTDPCAGKTITVNVAGETRPTPGQSNGSVTVSATGSSGFSFSINGGAFQSSGTFSNLAAGNYSIVAKDGNGCTGSRSVTLINDPCLGKTIVVTPTPQNSDKCLPTGSVSVSATGSTGFTFKLNNGAYQSSNTFNNVPAGTHTVFARDADGCERSAQVTVGQSPDGPLFTAVRQVIRSNCGGGGSGCHLNGGSSGGQNFELDCNIVAARERIYQRAVVEGTMPAVGGPLPQSEKNKITAWRNAGGGAAVRSGGE